MGKKGNQHDGGIGESLKNSLSKFTGRVTLKAPAANEQPTAQAPKSVLAATPKPMTPPPKEQPQAKQPAPSEPQAKNPRQPSQSPPAANAGPVRPAQTPPQSAPQATPATTPSPQPAAAAAPAPAASANPTSNAMGHDVFIEGSLRFANQLVFDGRLKGTVSSSGDLSLQPKALVEASISVKNLIVAGKVIGNITATDSVHLAASATVIGDITTASLTMDPNSIFQGQAQIGRPSQAPAQAPVKAKPAASPTATATATGKAVVDVPPAPAPGPPKD